MSELKAAQESTCVSIYVYNYYKLRIYKKFLLLQKTFKKYYNEENPPITCGYIFWTKFQDFGECLLQNVVNGNEYPHLLIKEEPAQQKFSS